MTIFSSTYLSLISRALILLVCTFSSFSIQEAHGQNGKIMACYFAGMLNTSGDQIDPYSCTHIICARGMMSPDGINSTQPLFEEQYREVALLKKLNPRLKVMISISHGFPSVVESGFTSIMEEFALKAVVYLEKMGMDGLDLDWEFPQVFEKENYVIFIKILSSYLSASNLLLSMALPAYPSSIQSGFNLNVINSYVNFVTVMNYDYHSFRKNHDTITGYNSPLYTPAGESLYASTADSLTYFLVNGLAREKMLMGIPTYGRSWTLNDSAVHGLHSPAVDLGGPAPYSRIRGLFVYADVCVAQKQGFTTVLDKENIGEYLYNGRQWAAVEGKFSIDAKIQWLKERGLAGVGIWAYELDDLHNTCEDGFTPLLTEIREHLNEDEVLHFLPEHP